MAVHGIIDRRQSERRFFLLVAGPEAGFEDSMIR